jgi:hypothetical protein
MERAAHFEYEEVAGLAFYTGQRVYLLRKRNPPGFPLLLSPEERFVLSEAEFHRLWRSEQHIYLVTDALGEGQGVVDHRSSFFVLGHAGDRWVLSNKSASHRGDRSLTAVVP